MFHASRALTSCEVSTCLAIIVHCPGHYVSFAYFTFPAGRVCEACTAFDQRSVGISDRSGVRSEIVYQAQEFSKNLAYDAASRFEGFFSLSLERQRSAGKMAHQCTYTGIRKGVLCTAKKKINTPLIPVQQTAHVLRVRSSFGRAGKPTFAPKWGGRTGRARNKAPWTHWVCDGADA